MFGRITLYTILVFSIAGVLALLSSVLFVSEQGKSQLSNVSSSGQSSPQLTTDTWGIFDPKTGTVVAGNNTQTTRPIASVTKLFTAYAVLESKRAHASTTITWSDLAAEGEAGKLRYGQTTTPYDLLFPLLVESSNDASEAIHRVIGTDFDRAVTEVSNKLSLSGTHLSDASGLSDENVSEVTDLARFFSYIRRTEPHILDITELNMYISDTNGLINNDPARSLKNFTGGKHGYTDAAGKTFVGTFVLPGTRREVGVVLLGSKDLLTDIKTTLAYANAGQ